MENGEQKNLGNGKIRKGKMWEIEEIRRGRKWESE